MAIYNLPTLHGVDFHLVIDRGIETTRAYGLAFNDDADIVGETDARRFSGYCAACIAHSIISELLTELDIAHVDIYDYLHANGLPCHCD